MTTINLNSYENELKYTKLAQSTVSQESLEAELSTSDDNTSRGSFAKLSDFEEEKAQVVEKKTVELKSLTTQKPSSEDGYSCLRVAGLLANHHMAKVHLCEFFSTCEGFLPDSVLVQR
jgi:hypothetical protein